MSASRWEDLSAPEPKIISIESETQRIDVMGKVLVDLHLIRSSLVPKIGVT